MKEHHERYEARHLMHLPHHFLLWAVVMKAVFATVCEENVESFCQDDERTEHKCVVMISCCTYLFSGAPSVTAAS